MLAECCTDQANLSSNAVPCMANLMVNDGWCSALCMLKFRISGVHPFIDGDLLLDTVGQVLEKDKGEGSFLT